MTAVHDTRTDSTDVNDHADSLAGWDQPYEQVSPGRFEGRVEERRLGPLQQEPLRRALVCRRADQRARPVPGPPCRWRCTTPVPGLQVRGAAAA